MACVAESCNGGGGAAVTYVDLDPLGQAQPAELPLVAFDVVAADVDGDGDDDIALGAGGGVRVRRVEPEEVP